MKVFFKKQMSRNHQTTYKNTYFVLNARKNQEEIFQLNNKTPKSYKRKLTECIRISILFSIPPHVPIYKKRDEK